LIAARLGLQQSPIDCSAIQCFRSGNLISLERRNLADISCDIRPAGVLVCALMQPKRINVSRFVLSTDLVKLPMLITICAGVVSHVWKRMQNVNAIFGRRIKRQEAAFTEFDAV
jgi:hypothetical protein